MRNGQCTPRTTDILQALVTSDDMLDSEEAFAYPGGPVRVQPEILDPQYRIQNLEEVEKGVTASQARTEAARCLRCYRILMAAI
ncbi:MAG: hypothetical protein HKP58_17140 [Desulfatitalea sp.]|nr:hypothetical protein [Desulfatitalea sp.]NNK02140.1 hypothetical protein [Desulfatitalea sp.]